MKWEYRQRGTWLHQNLCVPASSSGFGHTASMSRASQNSLISLYRYNFRSRDKPSGCTTLGRPSTGVENSTCSVVGSPKYVRSRTVPIDRNQ